MMVISALLFFLPAINGLIGGAIGGYRVGTAGRAVLAALLPSVVVLGVMLPVGLSFLPLGGIGENMLLAVRWMLLWLFAVTALAFVYRYVPNCHAIPVTDQVPPQHYL